MNTTIAACLFGTACIAWIALFMVLRWIERDEKRVDAEISRLLSETRKASKARDKE